MLKKQVSWWLHIPKRDEFAHSLTPLACQPHAEERKPGKLKFFNTRICRKVPALFSSDQTAFSLILFRESEFLILAFFSQTHGIILFLLYPNLLHLPLSTEFSVIRKPSFDTSLSFIHRGFWLFAPRLKEVLKTQ